MTWLVGEKSRNLKEKQNKKTKTETFVLEFVRSLYAQTLRQKHLTTTQIHTNAEKKKEREISE